MLLMSTTKLHPSVRLSNNCPAELFPGLNVATRRSLS